MVNKVVFIGPTCDRTRIYEGVPSIAKLKNDIITDLFVNTIKNPSLTTELEDSGEKFTISIDTDEDLQSVLQCLIEDQKELRITVQEKAAAIFNQSLATPPPMDPSVLAHIFAFACQGSPRDFKNITLVSKSWKEVLAGDAFRQALHLRIAPEIFGRAAFMELVRRDPGEELPIPLEFLVMFKSGSTLLSLFPKSVKLTQDDGTVVEELCTIQNMRNWALKSAKGVFKDRFEDTNMWTLSDMREFIEETHWNFIDLRPFREGYSYKKMAQSRLGGIKAEVNDLGLAFAMSFLKRGAWPIEQGDVAYVDIKNARLGNEALLDAENARYELLDLLGDSYTGPYYDVVLDGRLQFQACGLSGDLDEHPFVPVWKSFAPKL